MIRVYNHLLSKVFRFHYHSQKVIGSLGMENSWNVACVYILPGSLFPSPLVILFILRRVVGKLCRKQYGNQFVEQGTPQQCRLILLFDRVSEIEHTSGLAKIKDLTHIPLEDTPYPSPTVSEGISFFVGVWGSLGYLPRVCGQNH